MLGNKPNKNVQNPYEENITVLKDTAIDLSKLKASLLYG